jgi:hypothetical protein
MTPALDETRMKMLGELAEMALVLARDLKEAALVAKTTEEKVRLADAFQKVGRGVRQSLALHAKMERDAQAAEREALPPADQLKARREGRAARLKNVVERLIWTEREKLEETPYVLRTRLAELIAGESRAETFLDTDPDLQIARLCEVLRIPRPTPADHPASDRHPRACPGDPDAPMAPHDLSVAAAKPSPPSAPLDPRHKAGDDGAKDKRFDSSA